MEARALGGVASSIDAPVTPPQNALDVTPLDGFEVSSGVVQVNPRTRNLRQRQDSLVDKIRARSTTLLSSRMFPATRNPATQT